MLQEAGFLGDGNLIAGCAFRVACYELRVAGYELRVAGYELRVAGYELRVATKRHKMHNKISHGLTQIPLF